MKTSVEEHYWQSKLHFDLPKTEIAYEFESKSISNEGQFDFELDTTKQQLLNAFCGGDELKLQIVLLTITGLLLNKYSGSKVIRFGTQADNQSESAGRFPEIIPLEVTFTEGATFRDLLNVTRSCLVDAVFYQNFDFKLVYNKFDSHDENPLYDVVCFLARNQQQYDQGPPAGNLAFCFIEMNKNLNCRLRFNNSRYSMLLIRDIANNFSSLLENALSNLDRSVDEIQFTLEAEVNKLVRQPPTFYGDQSFIERFCANAKKTPQMVAVVSGSQSITYNDLDLISNKVAGYIIDSISADDRFIAVYLDNSIETIVCLLAILKSGHAFVPVDKSLPENRVLTIIQDSKASMVFINGRPDFAFPVSMAIADVQDMSVFDRYGDFDAEVKILPTAPAYVIYTSGTSGTPKGVEIPHSAFLNYVNWAARFYTDSGRKVASFPVFTPISFDLTITSIFVPLLCSAIIIVYPSNQPDVVLGSVLEDERIGVLKLTPSHLKLMIDVIKRDMRSGSRPAKLHTLIVGGEALSTKVADEFQKIFPGVDIYNEYGPTEATVGCMIHKFGLQDKRYATVPIGLPIDNTSILLLGNGDFQIPIGAIGEIYIGGACLSSGYLNRPDLTQSRFRLVKSANHNQYYITGDLAKKLPDGTYLYVGRKDSQVKINGHRIELEEIENTARKFPGISAVSVVCKGTGSALRIALYFVAGEISVEKIKDHLSDWLPNYMVPQQYVQVRKIPLTSNGKVDIKSLILLGEVNGVNIDLPTTATEKDLYNIWMKYLEIHDLGINDSFYASGGDSIKSLGIMNDINKLFGVRLQVKDLYALKTIKDMANFIDINAASEATSSKEDANERELILDEISKLKSGILDQL